MKYLRTRDEYKWTFDPSSVLGKIRMRNFIKSGLCEEIEVQTHWPLHDNMYLEVHWELFSSYFRNNNEALRSL